MAKDICSVCGEPIVPNNLNTFTVPIAGYYQFGVRINGITAHKTLLAHHKCVEATDSDSEGVKSSESTTPAKASTPQTDTNKHTEALLSSLQKIEIFPHGVNYKPAVEALEKYIMEEVRAGRVDEVEQAISQNGNFMYLHLKDRLAQLTREHGGSDA